MLTYSTDSALGYKAKNAGALAIIRIWGLIFTTTGTSAIPGGSPGLKRWGKYHPIPVTELKKNDGEELRGLLAKGPVVVSLDVQMENNW